jgi:hypothetical protein
MGGAKGAKVLNEKVLQVSTFFANEVLKNGDVGPQVQEFFLAAGDDENSGCCFEDLNRRAERFRLVDMTV